VPVALNCCDVPKDTDAVWGVTAIDISVGELTVRVVEPVTEPDVALMTVLPGATLAARPLLLIVTTLVALEVQVTLLVRFCVVSLL
jgi:hypothetical protein